MLVPWTKQGTQRVVCADGNSGLMLGREGMEIRVITGKGYLKPQGRMRSSWMGACCCCCLVSLGQEKEAEASRIPALWGREGTRGEGASRALLGGAGGRSATSGPGLSRHFHPPLTGLGTPSESRGLIPPTRVQDMAESDSTGSPFGVNVCTTSGSRLLLHGERNNSLVSSVELKIIHYKLVKLHKSFIQSNLSFPFICLEAWTAV